MVVTWFAICIVIYMGVSVMQGGTVRNGNTQLTAAT